jgi:hypothetical protein
LHKVAAAKRGQAFPQIPRQSVVLWLENMIFLPAPPEVSVGARILIRNGTHGRQEEQQHNCFQDEHGTLVIIDRLCCCQYCARSQTKPPEMMCASTIEMRTRLRCQPPKFFNNANLRIVAIVHYDFDGRLKIPLLVLPVTKNCTVSKSKLAYSVLIP